MDKKVYLSPTLSIVRVQSANIIALSMKGQADDSEYLIKGNASEDIWGSSENFWEGSDKD